jgi:hypothetical protein
MKKFVFAAVCTLTLAGFVIADEFTAQITNVDGKTVTYYKTKADPDAKGGGKKGGGGGKAFVKDGPAVKATVADKLTVAKGTYNKDDMKWTVGDPIEGALTADVFKNASEEKGVNVLITTSADGKSITQILQTGGGKGGGKKKGG